MRIAYERLSRDDEQQGESNSITNQKLLLEDFAGRNSFAGLTHMTDDGWSGTRWDRPAITKLIDEVDTGNVALVLVKKYQTLKSEIREVETIRKYAEEVSRTIALPTKSRSGLDR